MSKSLLIGTVLLLALVLGGCTQSADASGASSPTVSPSVAPTVAPANTSGLTPEEQAELDSLSAQMAQDDNASDFDIDTSLD